MGAQTQSSKAQLSQLFFPLGGKKGFLQGMLDPR